MSHKSGLCKPSGGQRPAARLGLAKAYFSKGDVDKALQNFKQVVATSPGTAEAEEADAFIKAIEKPGQP